MIGSTTAPGLGLLEEGFTNSEGFNPGTMGSDPLRFGSTGPDDDVGLDPEPEACMLSAPGRIVAAAAALVAMGCGCGVPPREPPARIICAGVMVEDCCSGFAGMTVWANCGGCGVDDLAVEGPPCCCCCCCFWLS